MDRFTIAVFLHLVGMVGLFIGYGLEWVASSLLRRSTNAEEVRAWLRIYRLSLPISGPGLLLLILSGVYFASITESMKQGWLLTSLVAIVFAFGIGFVFILPRVRMLRAVLPEGNTPLSEAGRASVQDPVILTLIRVRFLLALGILYLMIAKPDLATSLFILLGAIVVGLISAATAWTAMKRVSLKIEAHQLTTDELLKRMPKEQAITLVQGILLRLEGSLNEPDIPAAKARMEKVLEELKRS